MLELLRLMYRPLLTYPKSSLYSTLNRIVLITLLSSQYQKSVVLIKIFYINLFLLVILMGGHLKPMLPQVILALQIIQHPRAWLNICI